MRGARRPVEAWIRRWWRGDAGAPGHLLSGLALPVELLFRGGVALRRLGYERGALPTTTLPVPVISVGNLAVGGTGKTPVAARVVEWLLELGQRPAVVARGYGEDELRLHRRWNPTVPVLADPRRADAGRRAVREGATAVVLDDGFQHRHLRRDLDLVLLAAEHPLPVRLLPRGPYREPLEALRRADLVLLTRKTAGDELVERWRTRILEVAPGAPLARIRFRPEGWLDLRGETAEAPERAGTVVAGIAGPEAFLSMVRERVGPPGETLIFPDHHDYGDADVAEIARRAGGEPVVTTEKDAVKLSAFGDRLGDVRVLRIRATFEEGEELLRNAVADVTDTRRARPGGSGPGGSARREER